MRSLILKQVLQVVVLIAAISIIACNSDNNGQDPNEPVDKTYTIEFEEKGLTFIVVYKALPNDEEPEYLAYIEEQLTTFMNSTGGPNMSALSYLQTQGDRFDITIEYEVAFYTGMNWDTAAQSFKMHNDWISTAQDLGPEGLTNARIRDAFNSVQLENPNEPVDKTYTIELEEKGLTFVVEYKGLLNDEEPEYLSYLKGELEFVANSTAAPNIASIDNLITNGGNDHVIEVKTGAPFEDMVWNAATRTFEVHHNWISEACDNDLNLSPTLRAVFNSVQLENGNNPTEYPLTLGTHPITLVDQTGDVTEAQVDRIQSRLNNINLYGGTEDWVIEIKTRDNIKIIVEDAEYSVNVYHRLIDGRTFAVMLSSVQDEDAAVINTGITNGLRAVAATPLARVYSPQVINAVATVNNQAFNLNNINNWRIYGK